MSKISQVRIDGCWRTLFRLASTVGRGALVAMIAAGTSPVQAEGVQRLTIATEGAFPPWSATDSNGGLYGYEIDLARELCRRMAAECQLVAQDWDGILTSLRLGRYEAVMAGVSITPARAEQFSFSSPYAVDPAVFAQLGEAGPPRSGNGLRVDLGDEVASVNAVAEMARLIAGKSVGLQSSTVHAQMVARLFPSAIVKTYDRLDQAALDLSAGRVNFLLSARSVVEAIRKSDDRVVIIGPSFSGGPLGHGVGVVVQRDAEGLAKRFSNAIAAAAADGSITALSNTWFGFDISEPSR
jgi:octopine/nopaline transport system substrate-binding protein